MKRKYLSFGEALGGKSNSLGVLRLGLASLVIFAHALPLGGFGIDPVLQLTNGQTALGSIAVTAFFAISGYLITTSGMSGDVVQFMWRRVLRIFPAFWLVLALTAFIIAPGIWVAEGRNLALYFSGPDPYLYFVSNWTLKIGTLGVYDLLSGTPYGEMLGASVFNGSLWTLFYEWACYLIIALLVASRQMRNAYIVLPLLAGFFALYLLTTPAGPEQFTYSLVLSFLCGGVLAAYSKRIPLDDRLGIFTGLTVLVTMGWGGFSTVGIAALAVFILFLAARLPQAFHSVGAKNDYSYGVYIYGFLVQQVFAYVAWHRWGYVPYVAASLLVSFGLAWISWHTVEKRAMALKQRGPGRGARFWWDRGAVLVTTAMGPRARLSKTVRDFPGSVPPSAGPAHSPVTSCCSDKENQTARSRSIVDSTVAGAASRMI